MPLIVSVTPVSVLSSTEYAVTPHLPGPVTPAQSHHCLALTGTPCIVFEPADEKTTRSNNCVVVITKSHAVPALEIRVRRHISRQRARGSISSCRKTIHTMRVTFHRTWVGNPYATKNMLNDPSED